MAAGLTGVRLAGRYLVDERIGAGGMAEVYRAEDTVLERPVAVKMLHPGLDDADVAHRRLRSEIRVLAQLSHPGLVSVFDAGNEAGRAFLVMQLVEGGTLAQRIAAGPLAADEAVRVTADLADVLVHLHGGGLVHRDVKPSNVLMGPAGRVLLTDFGIARALDAENLTGTNTTIGTAAYMAPEQVRGEHVGPAADVYALGLVLIECLTGTRVFAGDNPFAVAAARLHRSPSAPVGVADACPPGLVEAMTGSDPRTRPTAGEVAARLREPRTKGPAQTVTLPAPPQPTPSTQPARDLRHRLHTRWEDRPAAPDLRRLRDALARRGSVVAGHLRAGWARGAAFVGPARRGPVTFVAGVTLSLALTVTLTTLDGPPPRSPAPGAPVQSPARSSPTPAGAERLAEDLARLERAVQRR